MVLYSNISSESSMILKLILDFFTFLIQHMHVHKTCCQTFVHIFRLYQMLTDFNHSFTGTLCGQFTIKCPLKFRTTLWKHRYRPTLWNTNCKLRFCVCSVIVLLKYKLPEIVRMTGSNCGWENQVKFHRYERQGRSDGGGVLYTPQISLP